MKLTAAALAPVCAVSAMAAFASATTEEKTTTVWTGTSVWNTASTENECTPSEGGYIKITTSNIEQFKAGDKIIVTAEQSGVGTATDMNGETVTDDRFSHTVCIKHAGAGLITGAGPLQGGITYDYPYITKNGAKTIEFTIGASQAETLNNNVNNNEILLVAGKFVKITKVEYVTTVEVQEGSGDSSSSENTSSDSSDTSSDSSDTSSDSSDTSSDSSDTSSDNSDSSSDNSDTSSDSSDTSSDSSDTSSDNSDSSSDNSDTSSDSSDTSSDSSDSSSDNSGTSADGETVKTSEIEVKDIIEGNALNSAIFGNSTKTWKDVDKIEFSSEDLFSVQFSTLKDKTGVDLFTMGKDKLPEAVTADGARAETEYDPGFATNWIIDAPYLAVMATEKPGDGYFKLTAKNKATIKVTAKITFKAESENPGNDQQPTGITVSIVPVVLAGAAVIVAAASKKKK